MDNWRHDKDDNDIRSARGDHGGESQSLCRILRFARLDLALRHKSHDHQQTEGSPLPTQEAPCYFDHKNGHHLNDFSIYATGNWDETHWI